MSRVLTFSTKFPAKHPKQGLPTYFIEEIFKNLYEQKLMSRAKIAEECRFLRSSVVNLPINFIDDVQPYLQLIFSKGHTLRAGHRWKVGDKFSPRAWGNDINPKTGKSGPYHSKQITFAPDIEIKRIWNVEIELKTMKIWVNTPIGNVKLQPGQFYKNYWYQVNAAKVAANDGLELNDFLDWFKMHPKKGKDKFEGQIICWDENIDYTPLPKRFMPKKSAAEAMAHILELLDIKTEPLQFDGIYSKFDNIQKMQEDLETTVINSVMKDIFQRDPTEEEKKLFTRINAIHNNGFNLIYKNKCLGNIRREFNEDGTKLSVVFSPSLQFKKDSNTKIIRHATS